MNGRRYSSFAPKPKPFRLFALPDLPLIRILKDMDIIDLALCSYKSRRAIKSLRIKVDTFKVNDSSRNRGFELSIPPNIYIKWSFDDVLEHKQDCGQFTAKYTLNDIDFPTRIRRNEDNENEITKCTLYNSTKPEETPLQEVFELAPRRAKGKSYYVRKFVPTPQAFPGFRLPPTWSQNVSGDYETAMDIFIPLVKYLFNMEPNGYCMEFKWEKDFDAFFYPTVVRGKLKIFELAAAQYSFSDVYFMRSALQFVPENTKLILAGPFAGYWKWEQPLKQKYMEFQCGVPWLTLEHLLNSNFKQLTVQSQHHKISAEDIGIFIQNWTNRSDKELECLDINVFNVQDIHRKVYGMLSLMNYNKKRKLEDYKRIKSTSIIQENAAYNSSLMREIKRKDGLEATIFISNVYAYQRRRVVFHVWHLK
ncbi:hypothetical protein CRE_09359 [Caenorhabditis remanei]|uniref:Sdz-33 F-box domain-containing protein n=1 Tax=Caenorhabditis remanei TaxID=31234 RepID=E3LID7_CAERE|nr:hypothetical protein CRE_09359 [Caenorhabditis remanei]